MSSSADPTSAGDGHVPAPGPQEGQDMDTASFLVKTPLKMSSEEPDTAAAEPKNPIEFDADWNLTLVVGYVGQRFRVCRQALKMASSVWRCMFGPSFKEADMFEIDMPDDDPGAMAIVLRIAHLGFDTAPRSLNIDELYHMALLVNKYDLAPIVAPFWRPWVRQIAEIHPPTVPPAHPQMLFIAWVFGEVTLFSAIMYSLTIDTVPEGPSPTEPGCCSLESLEACHMPPGILARIKASRLARIMDVLRLCKDHEKLGLQDHCSSQDNVCNAAMIGSFIRSLNKAGVYPIPADPSACNLSLRQLVEKLTEITIEHIPAKKGGRSSAATDHSECVKGYRFDPDKIKAAAYQDLDTGLDDAMLSHMDAQRDKLGMRMKRKRGESGE